MEKPYIVCHMMMSVDGRIDCGMTAKLRGNAEYYSTLDALDAPNRVSGRRTAELEMAEGPYEGKDSVPIGKPGFFKAQDADGYEIVLDTKGTLQWKDGASYQRPLLIVTSERASREYLAYLEGQHISWIATGEDRIDLHAAVDTLAQEFGVRRMAVVGGGTINAGFLDAGLLDEVSILLGPGIDGRAGMASTFDGLPHDREPFLLKLEDVTTYDDGAIWIRYAVEA